jgi:diaminohydroxyphosphoribosylaminopyrimidine deaminase/5-amino-6-(5-phosphoribosylamino)uracil reductase
MLLAIKEGKRGAGFVSPNPLVGCVILDRDGRLLSKGYHARLGEAHAEVNALNQIEDPNRLDGAHVYITLEPCAHEGRTPSCAKTLSHLPIAAVTFGLQDPNPLVSGKGAEILRAAGKKVEVFSELQNELEDLAEIFLTNMKSRRPFVAVKVGASLDGKIALPDGSSQWITGEKSREHVQYLRGCYDAVLTGVGTFLRDNPRLNSRHPSFAQKKQKVILLDPSGKSFSRLKDSNLILMRESGDVTVVTGPLGMVAPAGVNHIEVPDAEGSFDLQALMGDLGAVGIHSFFVEDGPYTVTSFLRAKLVDRLYLFQAMRILGEGLSWTSSFSIASLTQAIELRNVTHDHFGSDLLISGRIN